MATISSTITLVDNMTSKLNTVRDAVEEVQTSLNNISGEQTAIDKFSWSTFLANAEAAGKKMASIGQQMTLAITAPLALLGRKMYGNATDYETAYVGMKKTVDGTEEQYERLKEISLGLSETTPMNYVDLMGIAQTGGNLGVKIDEMEAFLRGYSALQYATDQHISGESGAQLVADFLNITEGGVDKIGQFGSAIVHLGNNFNATEDQILGMGKRMAAAAHLAGITTPEILGMATAFRSVGINEEAGGSAASKLIKQFQLSAEVGGRAQAQLAAVGEQWESGIDFSNYLAGMKKEDLVALADSMGITTDAVQSMADSWVLLDQFAEVSGKTSSQFIDDWSKNPAQAMTDFFYGLNRLGEGGADSILATLDKMGLTEIRESNLIAAMASRPELFASAIQNAVEAYAANTAMTEEFNKQMGTQESQNAMLGNKLQNTTADFGQNLVTALQPTLDVVSKILDKFNSLSETDQTHIVNLLGALAITGPTLTAVGKTVEAVSSIAQGISKLKSASPGKIGKVLGAITNFAINTPVGNLILLAGAVAGVGAAIESIPTELDNIIEKAAGIRISFDEESVKTALSQIEQIESALDILNGNKATEDARLSSESVKMGWGTTDMFNKGLAYESALAKTNIERITNDYTAKILELQDKIMHSQDGEQNAIWLEEIRGLELARDIDITAARDSYSAAISELFNGMAMQYPEAAKQLETAAQQYDLMGILQKAIWFDRDAFANEAQADTAWANLMQSMYSSAFNLGYMRDTGYQTEEQLLRAFEHNQLNEDLWIQQLQERVSQDLTNAAENIADNPLNNFLATILQSGAVTENLDFSQVQGAFEGFIGLLDFSQAAQKAVEAGNPKSIGTYLTQGLADGVTESTDTATSSATTMGKAVVDALASALGVHSPSIYGIQQGMYVDQGLGMGVTNNVGVVIAAMNTVGGAVIIAANAIVNYDAGYTMGVNIGLGMAAGIRSQIGAVQAAAGELANAATSATSSALDIHSPSGVFYDFGEMSGLGYVNGLYDMTGEVAQTAGKLFEIDYQAANKTAWDEIELFNDLEMNDLLHADDKDYKTSVSDSDMKRVRELAEREVINQFTTAELHIEFTANNQINSDLDLDGVVTYLSDKVAEQLEIAAEGVH